MQVLLDEAVPVIAFYFGLPEQQLLSRIKAAGTFTMGTVTCLQEAQKLQAAGKSCKQHRALIQSACTHKQQQQHPFRRFKDTVPLQQQSARCLRVLAWRGSTLHHPNLCHMLLHAVPAGMDAMVVQGSEAGGHRGTNATQPAMMCCCLALAGIGCHGSAGIRSRRPQRHTTSQPAQPASLQCTKTVAVNAVAVAAGIDAMVVQGSEAGGHRGTWYETGDYAPHMTGTTTLVALLAQQVRDVPLLAAGGIMNGGQVAAALAAGAAKS